MAKQPQKPTLLTALTEAGRKKIPTTVQREVDAEAGYRCGNPRCQTLVAIEYHHIQYVSEFGTNESWNLIPLCPTCHARHHKNEITMEAIRLWKGLLTSLNQTFDRRARDLLLFLWHTKGQMLWYSGDGALQFAVLIAAGLAALQSEPIVMTTPPTNFNWNGHPGTHLGGIREVGLKVTIELTPKGNSLVDAWIEGNEANFKAALASTTPPPPLPPSALSDR